MIMVLSGHSSVLISDYIIRQAYKIGLHFTPFQLGRLVIIAHGRHLALTGKPLIRDRIEAWKHGPVITILYHELLRYDGVPVDMLRYSSVYAGNDLQDDLFIDTLSDFERSVIENVVKEYGHWTVSELYRLCIEHSSPWDICYTGKFGTEIPDSIIKQYYKSEMVVPPAIL